MVRKPHPAPWGGRRGMRLLPNRTPLHPCGGVFAAEFAEGEGAGQAVAAHGHGIFHQVAAALRVAGHVEALDGVAVVVERVQVGVASSHMSFSFSSGAGIRKTFLHHLIFYSPTAILIPRITSRCSG